MLTMDHVIARQRAEAKQIALNSVATVGDAHGAMMRQGIVPPATEPAIIVGGQVIPFSKFGDAMNWTLR